MSYKDYEPVDLARADFKIHQLESLEKDNIENAFAGYVKEVIGRINDGKEATVYLCLSEQDSLLTAKIFKARHFRHFNTDKNYRNFSKYKDRRLAKAMKKKSSKGEHAFHQHWIDSEWRYLNLLFDEGGRVPRPYAMSADGVLMEFIGDEQGAAPRLVNAHLARDALSRCGEQLQQDIERMLSLGIVHGDLSVYNILYHHGETVIIDVPQAMELHTTPNAWSMMHRDLTNLETFSQRKGVDVSFLELLYR